MSSVAEAFPTMTTHDEQSQVFVVLDEVVSKSVVSKGLINSFFRAGTVHSTQKSNKHFAHPSVIMQEKPLTETSTSLPPPPFSSLLSCLLSLFPPQLPDALTAETKSALIYALQNCHSIQETIKCLISYGVGTPGEKVQGIKVENDYLNSQIDYLKAKNTVLAHSF